MTRVRIVTDSTADLPPEVVEKLGIYVVPLRVAFGTAIYRDGIDINPEQFYKKLITGELSMSSPPAPIDFLELYERSIATRESIISIHISSHLSATINQARSAKSASGYDDITIIDSYLTSVALGSIVAEAAKAASEGGTKEEIIQLIENLREKIKVYFVVDTLEYLIRGGRIGKLEGFVGSLLNIKPILTMQEGMIIPFAKIRGKSKAVDKLLEIMSKDNDKGNHYFSLAHSADNEALFQLDEKIKNKLGGHEKTINSEFGPIVGTHVGPGAVGVAYYTM